MGFRQVQVIFVILIVSEKMREILGVQLAASAVALFFNREISILRKSKQNEKYLTDLYFLRINYSHL